MPRATPRLPRRRARNPCRDVKELVPSRPEKRPRYPRGPLRARRVPPRRAPPKRPPAPAKGTDIAAGTDDHLAVRVARGSSRTRRHASPCASSSGTAGAIAARRRDGSKARAARVSACPCTARDRRACASLASAQPAPGSKQDRGRTHGGALSHTAPAARTDSSSLAFRGVSGAGVSGVAASARAGSGSRSAVSTGTAAARAGAGSGSPGWSLSFCWRFPPELAYSHMSRSGHAAQLGVLFSQNTFPSVIMW